MKKIVSRLTILTLSAFLAAAALFFILYRYDNKYITRASVSQDGVVIPVLNGKNIFACHMPMNF